MSVPARRGASRITPPELLVFTPFGLRVRDRDWLEHRLALVSSITAPSLMSQCDQGFYWVILTDGGLPPDIREELARVVEPMGRRALVHRREDDYTPVDIVGLYETRFAAKQHSYFLSGRIDDDDAWSTGMVGAVRDYVASWLEREDRAPGLSLSFQDGLEWVMYEMIDVEKLMNTGERLVHTPAIREYRFPFISMSVFVCSTLSDRETAMGSHARVAERLHLAKGFATEVISTDSPMWLCCRHKQTGSRIRNARGAEIPLSLGDLARRFGLDRDGAQAYLDSAGDHRYAVLKSPLTKKGELASEWMRLSQLLKDPGATPAEALRLSKERDELKSRMEGLEVDVLGAPDTG